MLPSHKCNLQSGFNSEGVAPCLYMHLLRLQDARICQRQQRERVTGSHPHYHHHDRCRLHRREEDHGPLTETTPPLSLSEMCCHGQGQYSYGVYDKMSPAHKEFHRNRGLVSSRDVYEVQPYRSTKRSKHQLKYAVRRPRHAQPESTSSAFKGNDKGNKEYRARCSHQHSLSSSTLQQSSLVPKPIESTTKDYVCKRHTPLVSPPTAFVNRKRQEEEKNITTEDRTNMLVARKHHHQHHCYLRGQEDLFEAPHRLKHRPVQSPTLVNEEPHSQGILSPIIGDDRGRIVAIQAPSVSTTVASVTERRMSASKEYTEKIQSHKASIEALKRELRSIETASSTVTTANNAATTSNAISSFTDLNEISSFSLGLITDRPGQYPPASISPSDEAAARLADASGSASFGDIKSAIQISRTALREGQMQRKPPLTPEEDKRLPVSLQDPACIESESDSSPEQVVFNTIRCSLRESTSRTSSIPPPEVTSPGDAPKPPCLPRSSSFSSANTSDSSVVSYSRSQSLFSHGTPFSNGSSVSQQSSSPDIFSNEEQSFSTMSPSLDCCTNPHHPHRTCYECIYHSQGLLQSYTDSSHGKLIRHPHQHQHDYCDRKSNEERSKSHSSSCDKRLQSVFLKTLLSDEIALETISRQKKLLKRELTKQNQLVEELEEAKRRIQRLLEEKAKLEQKAKDKTKDSDVPQKNDKSEVLSKSTSSYRKHHRSSSSSKNHAHHRKSHRRFRGQFSDFEKEQNSEEEHEKVLSNKYEEPIDYVSHQKHNHPKSRHRRHQGTVQRDKNSIQTKSAKELVNKAIFESLKEPKAPSRVQKHADNHALQDAQIVSTASKVNEKEETDDLLVENVPPHPHSPPALQQENMASILASFQASSVSQIKSPEGSFISPSHHHELTSICLEPVPEGRVAETYSASRPYCSDFTTFLSTATNKDQVHETADLDVEEINSASTSASEGSEDIEPFPLPPAPSLGINIMQKSHPLPSNLQLKCGRELYEAAVETEGEAIPETSLLEHSMLLKPVAPIRLSQATVVGKPESINYDVSSVRDEVPSIEAEKQEKLYLDAEPVHHAVLTPSRKTRNRRKAARQRQKSAPEIKLASNAITEI